MCGRYLLDDGTWDAVLLDFPELAGFPAPVAGDIVPSMPAPSIIAGGSIPSMSEQRPAGGGKVVAPASLSWGFPSFDGKKLLINARAEGIRIKKSFADSIRLRRCVLPAAGFYEWDRARQKVTFRNEAAPVIYLAGIWKPFGEENRFVIITREANASMLPVHDRMPLMIAAKDVRDWLFDPAGTDGYLAQPLPSLSAQRGYEQMSFF